MMLDSRCPMAAEFVLGEAIGPDFAAAMAAQATARRFKTRMVRCRVGVLKALQLMDVMGGKWHS